MPARRLSDARNSNVIECAKYKAMLTRPKAIHRTIMRTEPRSLHRLHFAFLFSDFSLIILLRRFESGSSRFARRRALRFAPAFCFGGSRGCAILLPFPPDQSAL